MKAVNQSVIVKQIKQPEDAPVKTPNGFHPWAIEVVDIPENHDTGEIQPGDIVAANGNLKELANDHFVVNIAQIVAVLDKDEI